MTDKIELTTDEVKELEDDAVFKYRVIESLKTLTKKLDDHVESSEKFRDKVKSLGVHRVMQWFFISGIIVSILAMPFWMARLINS